MRLGTDDKKKTTTAIVLLAIAALFLVWNLSRDSSSAPAAGNATAAGVPIPGNAGGSRRSRASLRHHVAFSLPSTLDPSLRLDLLRDSESVAYEGTGRNVFQEQAEDIPRPISDPLTDRGKGPKPSPAWTPPQPTPPPPINLKFYGWASAPGEPRAVFLSQGDNKYVAYEGDIVARRYKVLKIGEKSVEIEDLLNNNRQTVSLSL